MLARRQGTTDGIIPLAVGRTLSQGSEGPEGDEGERAVGATLEVRVVTILGILAACEQEARVPAGRARPPYRPARAQPRGLVP